MNYYNSISKGYDELHKEEQEKKLLIVKELIHPEKDSSLLDVGCGTGISSSFNCNVIGIDPSLKLLEQSDKIKVNGVGELLPFKDKSFDYVVSLTALQNFDNIEKGLLEMKRVCKKQLVLSFLKKSEKKEMIMSLVKKHFTIVKEIEEDKDLIVKLINL
tara:strand:+ start:674 stop:1150 length:477 start_codon:yes stop_codon:yes gene_type:complete